MEQANNEDSTLQIHEVCVGNTQTEPSELAVHLEKVEVKQNAMGQDVE
jgi:hypothetical protein